MHQPDARSHAQPEGVPPAATPTPESRLRFTMRALAALRACNALLVEDTGEAELLARLCPALREAGGYGLAWIGLAFDDEARSVRPIAMDGATAYLVHARISWADDEWGRGPTGTAIRTGRPSVVSQVADDARFAPWRAIALGQGFASSVAVPFSFDGERAVLNLYDAEAAAFGAEEAAVLAELARAVAYGLTARRTAARLRATTEAHRRSEARLLEAQRIARVGWWEWDGAADQVTGAADVIRLFGLDPAAGPHASAAFLPAIAPEDRAAVLAAMAAAIEDGRPIDIQYDVLAADGSRRSIHGRAEAIPARDGRPPRLVGTVQDLSEIVRARAEIARREAELAHAHELERLQGAFLDDVTHELRGPLTALMGYADLLEDEWLAARLAPSPLFGKLHRQIRRLRGLVEDLLDAASLEAGTFRLRPEPVAIGPLVEDVVGAFRPLAEAAGLGLALRIAADLPPATLDPRRLDQVLSNVIGNAIKFTPAGGRVDVDVRPDGDALRLEVRDTGPGIAAADLPHVFERFRRVGEGVRKQGTGLGLAIARALVEAHGGAIEVASEPGKGTAFAVRVPLVAPPSEP